MTRFLCKTAFISLGLWLAACGGGGVSKYPEEDKNIEQTIGDDTSGENGSDGDSSSDSNAAQLPTISLGTPQFADSNVVVFLPGSASAAEGSEIANSTWTQLSGPTVEMLAADSLNNLFITPDVSEETELVFQLNVNDSENRNNTKSIAITIRPSDSFIRVLGGIVSETDNVATFTVRLSSASTEAITVNYKTESETATAGEDFEALSGELTFAPGEVSKTINVNLVADASSEDFETFSLQVSTETDGVIASNQASIVIRNVDGVVVDPSPSPTPTENPPEEIANVPAWDEDGISQYEDSVLASFGKNIEVEEEEISSYHISSISAYPIRYNSDIGASFKNLDIQDFDNDGDQDIRISTRLGDTGNLFLLNNGNNVFSKPNEDLYPAADPEFPELENGESTINGGTSRYREIVDLDGDGDFDVLATTVRQIRNIEPSGSKEETYFSIWENTGKDSFIEHPIHAKCTPKIKDMDSDGDLDLYCVQEITSETGNYYQRVIYNNLGKLSFIENKYEHGKVCLEFGEDWQEIPQRPLLDYDNNGSMDMVSNCYNSSYPDHQVLHLLNTDFSTTPVEIERKYSVLYDFDLDGYADSTRPSSIMTWHSGTPENTFLEENRTIRNKYLIHFPTDTGEGFHSYIDIDGDGDLDIIHRRNRNTSSFNWSENIGYKYLKTHYVLSQNYLFISKDLNKDGLMDIIRVEPNIFNEKPIEVILGTQLPYKKVEYRIPEGETKLGIHTASDPNEDKVSYSIIEGLDHNLFIINSETGEINLKEPIACKEVCDSLEIVIPRGETEPSKTNTYSAMISATDGTHTIQRLIEVTIVQPET